MAGKLLLVTGLSGSGKSTLVAAALKVLPELLYLMTYTTRPQRHGDEHGHEYIFVTQDEYDRLRADSPAWDHTEYAGYSYGADISNVLDKLSKGRYVICSIAPSPQIIAQVKALYGVESLIILIDTPREVAASRIAADKIRKLREESLEGVTPDYVFTPTGKLHEDSRAFTDLLKQKTKR